MASRRSRRTGPICGPVTWVFERLGRPHSTFIDVSELVVFLRLAVLVVLAVGIFPIQFIAAPFGRAGKVFLPSGTFVLCQSATFCKV